MTKLLRSKAQANAVRSLQQLLEQILGDSIKRSKAKKARTNHPACVFAGTGRFYTTHGIKSLL